MLETTGMDSGFYRVSGEDASSTCGNKEQGLGGTAGVVRFEGLTGKRITSTHGPDEKQSRTDLTAA